MATLKETKARIASVRSTLKITSAMKLVASAKLRKAQQAAENCGAYERELASILEAISVAGERFPVGAGNDEGHGRPDRPSFDDQAPSKVAVVALSSNSSLCGGFNNNVIKKAREVIAEIGAESVELYAIGRKIADALAKTGLKSVRDYADLSAHPSYSEAASLADELVDGYNSGRYSKVILVWNHFISTASQKPFVETYLPFKHKEADSSSVEELLAQYLIEPDLKDLYAELLPKTLRLRIYSLLLDSAAAEHAARTVAMQTATDNGNEILEQLTLEYNKGRQAKITAEILDLAGGQQE
ncbi:MAG: ATP synthase F1 subunit gamma [Bacteroidales bacterium]|nr:ATP synthase F1 subunit gamma [Bacteroidales bacterium]